MEFLDLFGIGDWLIESVTNVLRKASFWLCEQVYPLIPKLYEIVEVLAKYTFFTDETINKISRNIYILVSVLMLFALGTKLLSAIVNPENFSGDKGSKGKSFKATFFRSVIAVFLIILTPMFFNTAYDVQKHVIDNSLVERILLGVDLEGDTSGGQILAGYSFVTFCHPWDGDTTTEDFFNETINKDIKYISFLEEKINEEDPDLGRDGIKNYVETAVEKAQEIDSYDGKALYFNGLLCPAVGILIVYELILLAMDLGLRSVKLGLLQLMSPIVIASYIFKGEILSKWFKEVISTYLICFLKIAAITFMVFGMTELSGFLSRPELDPLSAGAKRITQLFIMIGLLQVIKLIPNIINGIFGTNIQSRGGIKGRLGEMAAVGGLAQKAWDALKTPATKIAGLGLAAGTFGLGGLAALGAGGWAAHKTWNKGWGNKGPLKDTKFGRVARTIGAGGSAVGTALTTKGGLFKSIGAGKKKISENEVIKQGLSDLAQRRKSAENEKFRNRINMYGYKIQKDNGLKVQDVIAKDADGNWIYQDALVGRQALAAAFSADNRFTGEQKRRGSSFFKEDSKDIDLTEAVNQRDNLRKVIDRAKGKLNKSDPLYNWKVDQLESFDSDIMKKKNKYQDLEKRLLDLNVNGCLTQADTDEAGTALRKSVNGILSSSLIQEDKEKIIAKDGTLDLRNQTIKDMNTAQSNNKADAKSSFDKSKEGATATVKEGLSLYEDVSSKFNAKGMYDGQGANNINNKNGYVWNDISVPVQQPQPQQQTSTPQQQPQPQPTPAPQQGTQQQAPVPGDANFAGSQPAPQQSGNDNPEHQRDGSYTPGVYSGNVGDINVTADVDLSELGTKLDTINDSVKNSGDKVSSAINTQGENISEKLNQSNERLKHIHSGITHVDTQIGEMNSNVDSINDKINKANDDDE